LAHGAAATANHSAALKRAVAGHQFDLAQRLLVAGAHAHDLDDASILISVKANQWPLAHTVIRHYKLHARASADGLVVTEYPVNRVALQAREDFYKFALELNVGGGR